MTGPDIEPDAELVRRARAGEQRAFSQLMARHKHWVYRFVRRYVSDADEAYDVTQDAFVSAMSNLHRYDPTDFGWTYAGLATEFEEYTRRYHIATASQG